MSQNEVDYLKDQHLKTLSEIPLLSITSIKESPMRGFSTAKDAETGVYVTNRGDVVGVMLTQNQYEDLVNEIRELRKLSKFVIDDDEKQ